MDGRAIRAKIKTSPVLMKSKTRVQRHGEVFTPQWVIDRMMAIPGIKEKAKDIYATFLEPSAGEGAFLLAIEDMKLQSVIEQYSKDAWGRYALWALSSIYGIELLGDNLAIARQNMLKLFTDYCYTVNGARVSRQSNLYKSAKTIIWANVVQGDTLTYKNAQGNDITFSRWNKIPGAPGEVQRVPFVYSSLFTDVSESGGTQLSLFKTPEQLDLFAVDEETKAQKFTPYAVVDIERVWKGEEQSD